MSFNETEFVPSFKVTSSTSSQRNEISRFQLLIMAQREFPIKAACQTYLLMLYDSEKTFYTFTLRHRGLYNEICNAQHCLKWKDRKCIHA